MSNDRTTLIIAIGIALFLWVYVHMLQEAPEARRVMRDVPVQMAGELASGLTAQMREQDQKIDLAIQGASDRVDNVMPGDVKAWVDLTPITGENTWRLKVHVSLPGGVKLARQPAPVTISTTNLHQKSFPVKITFLSAPPPGATVGQYLMQPAAVVVEGTEKAIANVRYVTITVDPTKPMTTAREIPPRPVDDNGERVPEVRALTASVHVSMASLTGSSTTRSVAVRPPLLLNQPRRQTVRIARVRPDVVTVTGEPASLDRLSGYIDTEPLDVRTLRKDSTFTVRLRVPAGITVVEGPEVRVDVELHPNQ